MAAKKKQTETSAARREAARKAGKARVNPATKDIREAHKTEVLRLRVEEGMDFREIAAAIQMSLGYAHGCFDEAIKEVQADGQELAKRARALMAARLDMLSGRLFRRAMDKELRVVDNSNEERGPMELADFEALNKLTGSFVRVEERKAKLLGLDAAEKLQVQDNSGLTWDRIAALQRKRKGK